MNIILQNVYGDCQALRKFWQPIKHESQIGKKQINCRRKGNLIGKEYNIPRKIPKISPRTYIFKRPFLRGLFLLIYGGKFTFQNRLGLYLDGNLRLKIDGLAYSWKEIYVSNLQKVFTETRLEDVHLSKTLPCNYFVYMDRGNQSQK